MKIKETLNYMTLEDLNISIFFISAVSCVEF